MPAANACFLLHGSGVDETTMVPMARQIAPDATLVAVRGRIPRRTVSAGSSGSRRRSFEQASIRAETSAFAAFASEAAKRHGLDLARATFLGYSNGANLVSSLMLLNPGPRPQSGVAETDAGA